MKIAVIGGGITGLTTALCLKKLGIMDVTVYERAPQLNEIGAGIWLQPNAIRVMKWLGLSSEIKKYGMALNKMEITDEDLVPIKKMKHEVLTDDFGNQTVAIHRGKLQQILYDAFSEEGQVILGREFRSYEEGDDSVIVDFGDEKIVANLILGADGIKSRVRESLFPETSLRDAKQFCWRGIANFQLYDRFKQKGKEAWGKGRRFGFSEISDKTVYWYAVMNHDENFKSYGKKELIRAYDDFDPMIADLIMNTEQIHTSGLMDLKRLSTWSRGLVTLIGDAAHATTPNMGQGAGQGIEDAYFLSHCLNEEENVQKAFKKFEEKRRAKVDYIVNTSWKFGKAAHNRIGQRLLKMVLKATPEKVMLKQMKKVYAVKMLSADAEQH